LVFGSVVRANGFFAAKKQAIKKERFLCCITYKFD